MSFDVESEFRAAITRQLETITPQLVTALQLIVNSPLAANATALRFEYDSPHFGDTFPVMFWFVIAPGQTDAVQKLLPHLRHTITEAVLYDPRFESAGLDTWAIALALFVPWFAECWESAGGGDFHLPAHLAHHDSAFSFDLKRRLNVRNDI